ncbi:unnamed protein product [Hydatigera taeniaeformis]|uniref:DUF5641 domain-containing protein n=1 Tax=Hydatigena taeniaeformis TaxID=6205 RepID=A0A0R3WS61_HYDTA|nr:unnamed protein product [Hydatigera taeniaeformis]
MLGDDNTSTDRHVGVVVDGGEHVCELLREDHTGRVRDVTIQLVSKSSSSRCNSLHTHSLIHPSIHPSILKGSTLVLRGPRGMECEEESGGGREPHLREMRSIQHQGGCWWCKVEVGRWAWVPARRPTSTDVSAFLSHSSA